MNYLPHLESEKKKKNKTKQQQCNIDEDSFERSILGPLLYVLYTSPVADIIKSHNLMYHLFADNTQLYVSFKLGSGDLLSLAKSSIEICV